MPPAAALTSQRLAVEEVRASQLRSETVWQSRETACSYLSWASAGAASRASAPGKQTECQRRPGGGCALRQALECALRDGSPTGPEGGLHQLRQCQGPGERRVVVVRRFEALYGGVVVAKADLQHAEAVRPERRLASCAPARRLPCDSRSGRTCLRLPPAQGHGEQRMSPRGRDDRRIAGHLPSSRASDSADRADVSRPPGPSTKAPRKASPPASLANAPLSRARLIQRLVSCSTDASSRRSAAEMAASSRSRRATS